MLKTIVKVSDVSNLSDARYCAGMGVEYIGFSMDTLPFEKYKEMRGWLAGVQVVGETQQTDWLEIQTRATTFMPDVLEIDLSSGVPMPDLAALQRLGLPIIAKVDFATANLPALFQTTAAYVEYFVLYNSEASNLDASAMALLETWSAQYPILLGFGIEADQVTDLLANVAIKGIALRGGEEIRPGFADMSHLMDVLEAIEED